MLLYISVEMLLVASVLLVPNVRMFQDNCCVWHCLTLSILLFHPSFVKSQQLLETAFAVTTSAYSLIFFFPNWSIKHQQIFSIHLGKTANFVSGIAHHLTLTIHCYIPSGLPVPALGGAHHRAACGCLVLLICRMYPRPFHHLCSPPLWWCWYPYIFSVFRW